MIVHYAADLDHSSVISDPGLKVDNVEELQAMWSLHSLAGLPGSFLQVCKSHCALSFTLSLAVSLTALSLFLYLLLALCLVVSVACALSVCTSL